MFESIDDAEAQLAQHRYFAGRELSTAVFLATQLRKPLYLGGEHGVGKSALAVAAASALNLPFIEIRPSDADATAINTAWAAATDQTAVLLLDEVDRFSATTLRGLTSRFTEPRVEGAGPTLVVLTDNGRAEPNQALRRATLTAWVGHPAPSVEERVLLTKVAGMTEGLSSVVCEFVSALRGAGCHRPPGVGELLDWAKAVVALRRPQLDADAIELTVGSLLKHPEDIAQLRRQGFGRYLRPALDVAA